MSGTSRCGYLVGPLKTKSWRQIPAISPPPSLIPPPPPPPFPLPLLPPLLRPLKASANIGDDDDDACHVTRCDVILW